MTAHSQLPLDILIELEPSKTGANRGSNDLAREKLSAFQTKTPIADEKDALPCWITKYQLHFKQKKSRFRISGTISFFNCNTYTQPSRL